MNISTRTFQLGRTVATRGALSAMEAEGVNPMDLLSRHIVCDWGNVPPDDWKANEDALKYGDRLLSSYKFGKTVFWVITEHDRSTTTILLPSEY